MTRFGTIMKTATARWHDGTLARKQTICMEICSIWRVFSR